MNSKLIDKFRSRNIKLRYYVMRWMQLLLRLLKNMLGQKQDIATGILINSIPKSGTHLVESALELFPGVYHGGVPTIHGWHELSRKELFKLKAVSRPGCLGTAHLPFRDEVYRAVQEARLKVIFVIRDPRDVVLSNIDYVTKKELFHRTTGFFNGMSTDEERVRAAVNGAPGLVSPIAEILLKFKGWLVQETVCVVRYEDLIGVRGGGSQEKQIVALKMISDFLECDLDELDLAQIANNVFSEDSMTFSDGKTGKWKERMSSDCLRLLEESCGDLLREYGY